MPLFLSRKKSLNIYDIYKPDPIAFLYTCMAF